MNFISSPERNSIIISSRGEFIPYNTEKSPIFSFALTYRCYRYEYISELKAFRFIMCTVFKNSIVQIGTLK